MKLSLIVGSVAAVRIHLSLPDNKEEARNAFAEAAEAENPSLADKKEDSKSDD